MNGPMMLVCHRTHPGLEQKHLRNWSFPVLRPVFISVSFSFWVESFGHFSCRSLRKDKRFIAPLIRTRHETSTVSFHRQVGENGTLDFSNFWHGVGYPKYKNLLTAGFLRKKSGSSKKYRKVHILGVFVFFSKTTRTILIIFGQNVEDNDTDQQKKTARQKLAPFLRYSSIKRGPKIV